MFWYLIDDFLVEFSFAEFAVRVVRQDWGEVIIKFKVRILFLNEMHINSSK